MRILMQSVMILEFSTQKWFMNLSIIILIMDQLNSALIKLRDRFLNSCSDFVEPGYYILSHKTNPLSQEEA